jgi:hypothetical protein
MGAEKLAKGCDYSASMGAALGVHNRVVEALGPGMSRDDEMTHDGLQSD